MPGTMGRISLLICLLMLPVGSAMAEVPGCGADRNVQLRSLDELTWKQLNRVYEQVGDEQFDSAHEVLQRMLRRAGKDEYLQAVLYQALAQVEWSRENFDTSLSYFEQAVQLDTLPDSAHFALMYQVAQLYFIKERYDDALNAIDQWFCAVPADSITPQAHVLKASISVQGRKYRAALEAIETAISMDKDPPESWYQVKLAAHLELGQYPQSAETLELLVQRWPDRGNYWVQLAQINYQMAQEQSALAVMALAYRKDLLQQHGDLLFLSGLYANTGVPYKAAQVLEKAIRDGLVDSNRNHWTRVAENWYAAGELPRALDAFIEAGKIAEDGDVDLRRGYILVDLERWPEALAALDEALVKGGLGDRGTGEAYLLRGMARFKLEDLDSASADWDRASRYEGSREAAEQWMNHLKEERLRRS